MIETELIEGEGALLVIFQEEEFRLPEDIKTSVLLVKNIDWNRDLSPWPAPRVFKKGENFSGHGSETLEVILDALKDRKEKILIAGYSLAGLFALYACTKTDRFIGCVSASGSMWFPEFDAWLKSNPVHCQYVYLSLGDTEKNTRNPLMAMVEDRTRQAYEIISKQTVCEFEMNPGNHFSDPQGRLLKGIRKALANI